MQLLIDLGNSAIKFCYLLDGELCDQQRELYVDVSNNGINKDAVNFESLLSLISLKARESKLKSAWIASVASDDVYQQLVEYLNQNNIKDIHKLSSESSQNGVTNAYQNPEQLGVDRWMSLLAVQSKGLKPAIIVSCGTALTIDAVDENGKHLGGFISAGVGAQLQILGQATALQKVEMNSIEKSTVFTVATDTENAVISGTLYSIVSWIDRIVVELNNNYKNNFSRVITGGDATLLLPQLSGDWCHEPFLTLSGIATVAGGS